MQNVDPNKTKNSEVHDLLNSCWKVIETVNKSKLLKVKVDNKMIQEFGYAIKLKNSPAHRWWGSLLPKQRQKNSDSLLWLLQPVWPLLHRVRYELYSIASRIWHKSSYCAHTYPVVLSTRTVIQDTYKHIPRYYVKYLGILHYLGTPWGGASARTGNPGTPWEKNWISTLL